jgi:hypothetical protein
MSLMFVVTLTFLFGFQTGFVVAWLIFGRRRA